jgi:hypothetical protein
MITKKPYLRLETELRLSSKARRVNLLDRLDTKSQVLDLRSALGLCSTIWMSQLSDVGAVKSIVRSMKGTARAALNGLRGSIWKVLRICSPCCLPLILACTHTALPC